MSSICINDNIISQFIHFYYTSLNNKQFENVKKFLREYTEIVFESNLITGFENIIKYYSNLILSTIKFEIIDVSMTSFSGRRCNILIFGNLRTNKQEEKNFVESIVFQQGKKNNFWIHSVIFRLI